MAKVPLQKVQVVGLKKHYKLLMQELHRSGVLEIIEDKNAAGKEDEEVHMLFGVFDLARIHFAINFLKRYQSKQSTIDQMLSGGKLVLSEEEAKHRLKLFSEQYEGVITECEKGEEVLVRARNELAKIPVQQEILKNFGTLKTPLMGQYNTEKTRTWIGKISVANESAFAVEIAGESNLVDMEILDRSKGVTYVRLSTLNTLQKQTEETLQEIGFEAVDFSIEFGEYLGKTPREVLVLLEQRAAQLQADIDRVEIRMKELTKHLDDLRIVYDYNSWRKTKNDLQQKIICTEETFTFQAWVPVPELKTLKRWIENAFVREVAMEDTESGEDEEEPTFIRNNALIAPFEAVTEMYGLPQKKEFDPTPWMAPFFFIFFGLCLSDVGYGTILAGVAAWFLALGQFSYEARKTLALFLLCGISAIGGGVILGGYFGMTPEQATWLVNPTTGQFYGQFLNPMEGSGPVTFLALALALGVVQLLFAIVLDFVQRFRVGDIEGAFADSAAWFFMIVSLLLFGTAGYTGLDAELFKNLSLIAAALLVITQGRDQKNWLLKPVFGLLGLYNITAYLSDILSYSRIMALGLATGVIGFAMNLTAGIFSELIPNPVAGFIVAVVVIILGHTLNFFLSLLGAFIHSGRLQFIEFFGKFYEGGGHKFNPFARQKKYLFFR